MIEPILCEIAACSQNLVIGKDKGLVWNLPADMEHFRKTTRRHATIMGNNTYQSLPDEARPLPKRPNFVLSRHPQTEKHENLFWVNSLDFACEQAKKYAIENNQEEYFVIGGEQLYRLAASKTQRLYLTWIEKDYDGDAFFPIDAFDLQNWKKQILSVHEATETTPRFTIARYDRS